ncbi:glucose-6-phosphate isomerase [Halosquirtibacter laminarini]|uniref:Glucose-6-phosphate isomerase n=1 Tax=Halosquirtibacter laminarini TaxID=3374600 RepID=A0AC61NG06_9BACT|nr:glucose-6-phosphate isomerase [Prolixibacteraceae bacterium]
MENISLDFNRTLGFISQESIDSYKADAEKFNLALHDKTMRGNDFLGWVNLPSSISNEHIEDVEATAAKLSAKKLDILVVVGIGGSYLGAKAVIDALSNNFQQFQDTDAPHVIFAGQNISEDYLAELRVLLQGKEYGIVVISKSGTTTEPALAFRVLKKDIEDKYGKEEAVNRIIAVTDASKGALRQLATEEGYKTFVIPDDVGGRFSVLTPVGLIAIACAGFDIRALINGAKDMEAQTSPEVKFEDNIAAQYAAVRNELYKKGKKIEILVNYNPKLHYFAEWWKQLYGESEGKEGKGIYPSSVDFSSDLHSMGQYIQEGERTLFETVLSVKSVDNTVLVPKDEANLDSLNFLAGKHVDEVNKMAELGTVLAHVDGGVPNLRVEIPKVDEYYLGQMIYFFEKACGISGYMLDVNPFDQPGVEAYKKNMFALLEKPGYEQATEEIKKKLK